MTTKELVEILETLKKSPGSIPNSDNFFMDSPLFEKMLNTLKVVEHDFGGDGEGKFVLFSAKDAPEKIRLAAKIYEDEEGDNKSAVQFSCDFTHLPGGLQLGIVCVEDCDHKAWPTSYIISPSENSHWAEMVMRITVDLINSDPDANRDKALVDGAQALSNAATECGCLGRGCFTHTHRLPNGTKKNGKRGSKGSFCAYLSGASFTTGKGLNLKDAVKVHDLLYMTCCGACFIVLSVHHLIFHAEYF